MNLLLQGIVALRQGVLNCEYGRISLEKFPNLSRFSTGLNRAKCSSGDSEGVIESLTAGYRMKLLEFLVASSYYLQILGKIVP